MFMWHNNLFTFYKTFWQEVTKIELYWIYLSFVRKRAPLNIQIKLTNFVKLLNCVSLKSSKNGLSRPWKIELLCLFAIQDKVAGEKSSNLRGNYLRQRRLPKYGMLTSFGLS